MSEIPFRLAAISDSHGNREMVDLFLRELGRVDAIVHLGDGAQDISRAAGLPAAPLSIVRGNCDLLSDLPESQLEIMAGVKVFMCHGHRLGVKLGLHRLRAKAREHGAALALYGHTHKQRAQWEGEDLLLVNPGMLSLGQYAIIEIPGGRPAAKLCNLSVSKQS